MKPVIKHAHESSVAIGPGKNDSAALRDGFLFIRRGMGSIVVAVKDWPKVRDNIDALVDDSITPDDPA